MEFGEMMLSINCKKQGTANNALSVPRSFLNDGYSRNLVNTYFSNWLQAKAGVPQESVLCPLIFLAYTEDVTMEESSPDNTKLVPLRHQGNLDTLLKLRFRE